LFVCVLVCVCVIPSEAFMVDMIDEFQEAPYVEVCIVCVCVCVCV
jgi:hypothetical protein